MLKTIQQEKPAVEPLMMPPCIGCGEPYVSSYVDASGRALNLSCDDCTMCYNLTMEDDYGPRWDGRHQLKRLLRMGYEAKPGEDLEDAFHRARWVKVLAWRATERIAKAEADRVEELKLQKLIRRIVAVKYPSSARPLALQMRGLITQMKNQPKEAKETTI